MATAARIWAGTTRTIRSQSQAKARNASPSRPMSRITSSKPRRAASRTVDATDASTVAAPPPLPGQDRKENPPTLGNDSTSCPGSMLPLAPARSGQRRPGASSAAKASSSPPPRGSPSTRRTLRPVPGSNLGQPDGRRGGSRPSAAPDDAEGEAAGRG